MDKSQDFNIFKIMKETYWCSKCELNFDTKESFYIHLLNYTYDKHDYGSNHMQYIEPYGCMQCHKRFEIKSDFILHSTTKCLDAPFICTRCYENCKHLNGLKLHLIYKHGFTPEMLTRDGYDHFHPDVLKISHERILREAAMNNGVSEEAPNIYNIVDNTVNTPGSSFRSNGKFPGKTYICEICHESFSRKCSLDSHVQKHIAEQEKRFSKLKNNISVGNIKKNMKNRGRQFDFEPNVSSRNTQKINTDILKISEQCSGVEKSGMCDFLDSYESWKKIKLTRKFKKKIISKQSVAGRSKEEKPIEMKFKGLKTISTKPKTSQAENIVVYEIIEQQTGIPKAISQLSANIDTSQWQKIKLKRKIKRISVSDEVNVDGDSESINKQDNINLTGTKDITTGSESGKMKNVGSHVGVEQCSSFPNAVSQFSGKISTSLQKRARVNQKIKLKSKVKNVSFAYEQIQSVNSEKRLSNKRQKKTVVKIKPQQHHLTQKNEGKEVFLCEICLKEFKDRYKLTRHLFIHSGKRPYNCEKCNKSFARDDHLKRHIKKVCSKEKKSE